MVRARTGIRTNAPSPSMRYTKRPVSTPASSWISATRKDPDRIREHGSLRTHRAKDRSLVSCLRNSLHNSRPMPPKNLPFPLPSTKLRTCFSKEGLKSSEKIPPLKKGDRGGFEYDFSRRHRLEFLHERLKNHTRQDSIR